MICWLEMYMRKLNILGVCLNKYSYKFFFWYFYVVIGIFIFVLSFFSCFCRLVCEFLFIISIIYRFFDLFGKSLSFFKSDNECGIFFLVCLMCFLFLMWLLMNYWLYYSSDDIY